MTKNTKKGKPVEKETPLMRQYNGVKSKYPDALLLFRVGDFYETFGKDAVKVSKLLGIVLTKRHNGAAAAVELAGFPHHSLDTYLPKLVRAGERVAICDQLEDPKRTKKIVKRGVTEVVTPGVSISEKVLDHNTNNFLGAIHFGAEHIGTSFLDVSTGEFLVAEGSASYVGKLLQSFQPSEILVQKAKKKDFEALFSNSFHTFPMDDWVFSADFADECLKGQFKTTTLKGFGIDHMSSAIIAAGVSLHYLKETQHDRIAHISKIARVEQAQYVWLDKFTIRNLELIVPAQEQATSLVDVLDDTVSPMGARLLRRWVTLPLMNLSDIKKRHEAVDDLLGKADVRGKLRLLLSDIGDLERLVSKIAMNRISPKEVEQLSRALNILPDLKQLIQNVTSKHMGTLSKQLDPCSALAERIGKELIQDPPAQLGKGSVIADGVNAKLDELRKIAFSGKDYLLQMQQREMENTGISSLKIAYNNVFGYYIEVRNAHKDKVPEGWIRKQTLVNAERYITQELKAYEEKILGAEEKILALEAQLFNDLVEGIATYLNSIQKNATCLAEMDCLSCFAELAEKNHYVKPTVDESKKLEIKNGRHPVIEKQLPLGEAYVANDVYLDTTSQQIMIITGPNMSGKSALLRQTALIVLMAQIGCFVPAETATIGLVDKIFTRVGASDNISSGESTFMVEMNETASILNNLSDRSLLLLDEIGRGTSTYDGISIAWAICEFLHENKVAHPKTLFATHYHELNDLCKSFSRIKNFNVSVKEVNNTVLFLRKLQAGGSEHSFGIHVAKMAGIPSHVVRRASEILHQLEKSHARDTVPSPSEELQLSFFQLDDPSLLLIKEEVESIDIDQLTPIEALLKLNEIKKIIQGKSEFAKK